MCGIAGYIGRHKLSDENISRTLTLMTRRGPDSQDSYHFHMSTIEGVFLHSRLGIIDLKERSNQPFVIGDYTAIFNGEIYNYVELKCELIKTGIEFKTNSDTEVLLQAYINYGCKCFEIFEGMWSVVILDKTKNQFVFSRDRFGEKPLYYCNEGDGIYFGSEVKFLSSLSGKKINVNNSHIARYLVNGYKSLYKGEETFYENVKEVKRGTYMLVDCNLNMKSFSYWNPEYKPQQMSLNEAISGFKEHLIKSVELRLRADVPMAFCLSGGVDSASLASIAVKEFGYSVHTFSLIDNDERYNEMNNIKATLDDLNCRHTVLPIPCAKNFDRLKDLVTYHDAPIMTPSYYIHSFISESINELGYRIAISGTAADELVTGYYDHQNLFLYEMQNHPNYKEILAEWHQGMGKYVRNPILKNPECYFNNSNERAHVYLDRDVFNSYMKTPVDEMFYEETYSDNLMRNRMMNEMFNEVIPVILHEDDLNSMRYSIENRSPYLDRKLFEFAYSIPNEYLIKEGYTKYILRESVKGILNDKVRLDKHKKGFNASIYSLFDFSSNEIKDYLLSDGPIFDIVNKKCLDGIMNSKDQSNEFSKFMFNFICAKLFLDNQK